MLRIRLTRVGKKNDAQYRIVVADSKKAVKSKFISIVGWYNPHSKEINLKKEEIENWIQKGAQPSNTVAKMLKKEGLKLPEWVKIVEKVKKPKKAEEPVEKQKATDAPEATAAAVKEARDTEATEEAAEEKTEAREEAGTEEASSEEQSVEAPEKPKE